MLEFFERLSDSIGPVGAVATSLAAIGAVVIPAWKCAIRVAAWMEERERSHKLALSRSVRTARAIARLERHVRSIRHELTFNGGGSLKDIVIRLDQRIASGDAWHRAFLDTLPHPAWRCDSSGSVVYVNPRVEALAGRSQRDLLGSQWLSSVVPEDRERVRHERSEAISEDRDYDVRLRIRKGDGDVVEVVAKIVAVRDGTGTRVGWLGTAERADGSPWD
jgi:PAS domain S-box-containing protein